MFLILKTIGFYLVDIADLLSQERTVLTPPGSDFGSPAASPSQSSDSGTSNPPSPIFQEAVAGTNNKVTLCNRHFEKKIELYFSGLYFSAMTENFSCLDNAETLLAHSGMANASRMVLCVFMLGVLAFNPFQPFLAN